MNKLFIRNLSFIKAIIKIHIKIVKEYKINIYMGILANIMFVSIMSYTFFVLKSNFDDIFYWNIFEFMFFLLFLEFFLLFFSLWLKRLSVVLVGGEFNIFLLRPINNFISYMFLTIEFGAILVSLLYLILILLYLVFLVPEFNLLRFVVAFVFGIVGGFFYLSFNCFTDSLAFYIKKNNFIRHTYYQINNAFAQYPSIFFNNTPIETFGMFVAVTYFSAYATDFYFGYIGFEKLLDLFFILFCLIGVLFGISFLLWKFGLKKYEAFG